MKKLLILDAGHGYDTKGKRNEKENFYEYEFNNKMQYLIKDMLKNYDIEVVMTNPYPNTVSDVLLNERVKRANKWYNKNEQQLFISIHANAFSDSNARGTETYTANNASANSEKFCKMVNDNIFNVFKKYDCNAKNRGCKKANFVVIRDVYMPSVLIEYGFYTNISDLKILKNKQYELAEATVNAILSYFNMKEVDKVVTTAPSNNLYRVCVGSYYDIQNAYKMQEALKAKGIESFLYVENKK